MKELLYLRLRERASCEKGIVRESYLREGIILQRNKVVPDTIDSAREEREIERERERERERDDLARNDSASRLYPY